jgi:hypothetical protein
MTMRLTPKLTRYGQESSGCQSSTEGSRVPRVLGNENAVPADLTSMMMRRLIRLIVLSFSFAFILTAAAGPVVAVVACAGVLIYTLAKARGDAARRAEAAEAEAVAAAAEAKAAAEAVIAEAEAVIAAARLRLFGEAAS